MTYHCMHVHARTARRLRRVPTSVLRCSSSRSPGLTSLNGLSRSAGSVPAATDGDTPGVPSPRSPRSPSGECAVAPSSGNSLTVAAGSGLDLNGKAGADSASIQAVQNESPPAVGGTSKVMCGMSSTAGNCFHLRGTSGSASNTPSLIFAAS